MVLPRAAVLVAGARSHIPQLLVLAGVGAVHRTRGLEILILKVGLRRIGVPGGERRIHVRHIVAEVAVVVS